MLTHAARLTPLALLLLGPLTTPGASAQAPVLESATSNTQTVTLTVRTTTQTPMGVNRYWIWRSTVPGLEGDIRPYATRTLSGTSPAIGSTLHLTDATAARGLTYFYRVALASNRSFQVPKSNELGVVSQVIIAPPAQLRVVAGVGGQVLLAWSKVEGAARYSVKRSATGGSGYVALTGGITTTCLDTGLKDGAPHYYVVTALSAAGAESEGSNSVFVMPSFSAYRIDVGSETAFADVRGGVWMMDKGIATGGATALFAGGVQNVGASDRPLYRTQRIGRSFTYTLAAPNGDYLLGLLFAELDPSVNRAGLRVCRVTSGGQMLLTCDAFAEAGAGGGVTEVIPVKVTGGFIALTFTGVGTDGTAALAALQLGLIPPGGGATPFIPGVSTPVPDTPAPGWGLGAIPMDGD